MFFAPKGVAKMVPLLRAGGNYVVRGRGNFTLRDGKVTPVTGRSVLVVSDLDDTMVRT